MANIAGDWNKSMPSGSSSIADGDDLLRQHWRSLESTIGQEHRMSSVETLAGFHKQGSARVYTGLSSALSSDDLPTDVEEGRLFSELDTGRLWLVGASALTCISPGIGAFNYADTVASIPFGTTPAIFDASFVDLCPNASDTWITLSGNTLEVPSGASGFYWVTADLFKPLGFSSGFSGTYHMDINIRKNVGDAVGLTVVNHKSGTTMEHLTQFGLIPLKDGDTVGVRISSNTNLTVTSCSIRLFGHKVG